MSFHAGGNVHMATDNAQYRFYEKVLNVKADVAAILNSFLPCGGRLRSDPAICGRQRPFHRCQDFARTADALTVEDQLSKSPGLPTRAALLFAL